MGDHYWKKAVTDAWDSLPDTYDALARLIEPRPTREQVEQIPALDDCFRIPYYLIFDLVPH